MITLDINSNLQYEVVMWKHCILKNKNTQKYFRNEKKTRLLDTKNCYNKTVLSVHCFFQNTKTWPDCIKIKIWHTKRALQSKTWRFILVKEGLQQVSKYKHNIFYLLLQITLTHSNYIEIYNLFFLIYNLYPNLLSLSKHNQKRKLMRILFTLLRNVLLEMQSKI